MHKTFECDWCGKLYNCKTSITQHIFTHHVNSEPKHECDVCHKKFQLPSLVKLHKYRNHREKIARVTCELCGKSFNANVYLKQHMLTTHTDKAERLAMRQQCEHCGEWLMSKTGINYHKQVNKTKHVKNLFFYFRILNSCYIVSYIQM